MIHVAGDRLFLPDGRQFRCAIGRGGYSNAKQEGDGATPIGVWPLRLLYYRADRLAEPKTGLAIKPIAEDDGWCDAPDDPAYNRRVTLPYSASHEEMWREDGLYDLVVVLGHNDDPPIPGLGSAIFMHIARDGYNPTEGCIALAREDLLTVLETIALGDRIEIRGP